MKERRNLDRLNEIVKLRQGGLSYAEIGRRLGISGGRAWQIVNPKKGRRPVMPRHHPLFTKYKRDWLHQVTGFSKGYLCRVATGEMPLPRSFIERVCFRLGVPEEELFLLHPEGTRKEK